MGPYELTIHWQYSIKITELPKKNNDMWAHMELATQK